MDKEKKLEMTKKLLRSVLIGHKSGVPMFSINGEIKFT